MLPFTLLLEPWLDLAVALIHDVRGIVTEADHGGAQVEARAGTCRDGTGGGHGKTLNDVKSCQICFQDKDVRLLK